MPIDKMHTRKGSFLIGGACPAFVPAPARKELPDDSRHFEAVAKAAEALGSFELDRFAVERVEIRRRLVAAQKRLEEIRRDPKMTLTGQAMQMRLRVKNLMQKHRVAPRHVNTPLSAPVDGPVVDGSLKIPLSIELAIEALEARWRRGRKP